MGFPSKVSWWFEEEGVEFRGRRGTIDSFSRANRGRSRKEVWREKMTAQLALADGNGGFSVLEVDRRTVLAIFGSLYLG